MEKIGFVTEETADLPPDIIERNQIAIVPVKLDWPEIENLPGENTFQKMRELEKKGITSFGKTSQPSPKEYLEKYKQMLERFNKVICISLTSKHSGCHNSAIQARNFLEPELKEKVFVIDSLNGSAGQALLILKALDLAKEGKEAEEIVKEIEEIRPQIHLYGIIEDPKWLEASGRISHLVANLLRKMMKAGILPMLFFKNGKLTPSIIRTKAKDKPSVILEKFSADIKKFNKESSKIRAVITHGDTPKEAQRLKEIVEKEFKNVEIVFLNIINNVVGSPTGPGILVFSWCEI